MMPTYPGFVQNDVGASINALLDYVIAVIRYGETGVFTVGAGLMLLIGSIDLGVAFILVAVGSMEFEDLKKSKLFTYLMYGFIFTGFPSFMNWLVPIVKQTGIGFSGAIVDSVPSPGSILYAGFLLLKPVGDALKNAGIVGWIIGFLAYIGIFFQFARLAMEYFILMCKLSVVLAFGGVLIPFGLFDPIKHIAEKYFRSVVTYLVQLLLFCVALSISIPFIMAFTGIKVGMSGIEFAIGLVAVVYIVIGLTKMLPEMAGEIVAGNAKLSSVSELLQNNNYLANNKNNVVRAIHIVGQKMEKMKEVGKDKKVKENVPKE